MTAPNLLRLLRPVTGQVSAVERLAPDVVRVVVTGKALAGLGDWRAGQDLAVNVGAGWLSGRHYSPARLDPRGELELWVHLHGNVGPGERFFADIAAGANLSLWGPTGQFTLDQDAGRHVLAGDLSTVATFVAMAERARGPVHGLIERAAVVDDRLARELAARGLGVTTNLRAALAAIDADGLTTYYLAGCAKTIQTLRNDLRARGVERRRIRTCPYWADGRAGLG